MPPSQLAMKQWFEKAEELRLAGSRSLQVLFARHGCKHVSVVFHWRALCIACSCTSSIMQCPCPVPLSTRTCIFWVLSWTILTVLFAS